MIKRLRTNLALLLSLVLCLSFSPQTAYAGDGDAITILKRAPVDIVFVIDSTGSMGGEIAHVKANIKSFLDQLYNYNRKISEASDEGIGIDPRIALIDYKDVGLGQKTTFHKKDAGSYWFVKTDKDDDGDALTASVDNIHATGGGSDVIETPTEAMAMLYKKDDGVADVDGFEWRDDAQKFVFLITDAGFKKRSDSTTVAIPDMSEVINEFSKLNIRASVVTDEANKAVYNSLYTETGGKMYDINGTMGFMEEIIKKIDEIIETPTVNVSVNASGAPAGIGSVKLIRYIDKDGVEHEGPTVYCGDDTASASVSFGSLIDLEISANEVKNGVKAPEGDTYIIDRLTVNGESLDLSKSDGSNYRIHGLMVKDDTIIEALFKIVEVPASYTVWFDSNGGSQVPSQTVIEGEKASMPDDPEREGYTFNHWYLSDEKTPFDFNSPVMSDLTLKASWTLIPASYTVRFDSNGGSPVPSQIVKEGEKASVPDNPERAGYAFNYWYLHDENKPFNFDTPITSDITLTASWNLIEKEEEEKNESVSDNNEKTSNDEAPTGLPSDWTLLRHVTPENAISSDYCVIARKQRFDVKPHINGAVIYKSSNKRIASVRRKKGIVKGKRSGDAVITGYVKSGRQLIPTGSYTIHVVTPELNKKQYLSFNTDGSIDGNEHIVNEILIPTLWTSSNPSVATVSSNSGRITVLNSKGKARITAFYGLGRNAARYRFTLRIKPSGG